VLLATLGAAPIKEQNSLHQQEDAGWFAQEDRARLADIEDKTRSRSSASPFNCLRPRLLVLFRL
jgi:hypothetical protein